MFEELSKIRNIASLNNKQDGENEAKEIMNYPGKPLPIKGKTTRES